MFYRKYRRLPAEADSAYAGEKRVENREVINDVLVHLFNEIMELEEQAIITEEYKDITNNDMHIIEAIGMNEPKNMSTIAREISVTVGTLTIAMNSLVKKGYVLRERGKEDRRVVYISLTERGRAAYVHHARFHKAMIDSISDELTSEEMELLIKTLTKLDKWFRNWQEN